MRTKQKEQSEATRKRILDSAMALFQDKGFDGATMRDVAAAARMSLGAAYHYFDSKDDIVMVFYRRLLEEEAGWTQEPGYIQSEKLEDRLFFFIRRKLEQLTAHRRALEGVFRKASDPQSPLSPFSQETRAIREGNIALFVKALEISKHSLHADFQPVLPKMIWLYQMGIVLAWFYDRSPGQTRSRALLDMSLPLLLRTLETLSLPFMGAFRQSLLSLIKTIDGIMEEPMTVGSS